MGPSDDKVADVVHRMSVLGRAGDVKELKGAYLVSASTALLGSPVIEPRKSLTRVRCPSSSSQYLASNASTYTTGSEMLVDGEFQ